MQAAVPANDLNSATSLDNEDQSLGSEPSPAIYPVEVEYLVNTNSPGITEDALSLGSIQGGYDLAQAMESRCNISGDDPCAARIGPTEPIQASSLPPAVAEFVAYEETRTDLPAPVIFMRNCVNSTFCFMVNQAFQDRVMKIANFQPPSRVDDMKKMYALLDISSQGIKAPSPTDGIVERSIKL